MDKKDKIFWNTLMFYLEDDFHNEFQVSDMTKILSQWGWGLAIILYVGKMN